MKELTQKEVRRLFSYNKNTGVLRWKRKSSKFSTIKIGDEAGSMDSCGYLQVKIHGNTHLVHKLIWIGVYGHLPKEIDHINRIKHNNWLSNLRESSRTKNIQNTGNSIKNTSGIKGVSFYKKGNNWKSYITINKRKHHLGYYSDIYDAACARLAAEQCLDWEGCYYNSPAYKYVEENIIEKKRKTKKSTLRKRRHKRSSRRN